MRLAPPRNTAWGWWRISLFCPKFDVSLPGWIYRIWIHTKFETFYVNWIKHNMDNDHIQIIFDFKQLNVEVCCIFLFLNFSRHDLGIFLDFRIHAFQACLMLDWPVDSCVFLSLVFLSPRSKSKLNQIERETPHLLFNNRVDQCQILWTYCGSLCCLLKACHGWCCCSQYWLSWRGS